MIRAPLHCLVCQEPLIYSSDKKYVIEYRSYRTNDNCQIQCNPEHNVNCTNNYIDHVQYMIILDNNRYYYTVSENYCILEIATGNDSLRLISRKETKDFQSEILFTTKDLQNKINKILKLVHFK